jgi:membrane protein
MEKVTPQCHTAQSREKRTERTMWKRIWTILREAAKEWVADNASRLAAALAFYTILSVAPLLVIATAIAGQVFGSSQSAADKLVTEVRGFVGDAGAEVVKTTLEHADRPKAGIVATIIGVVTLLFGASGVFGELQSAMNVVWNVKPKPGRGIWATIRDRFLSFGMVLVVGFLLLVSLVVTTALTALSDYLAGQLPGLPTLMHVANFVLSFVVVAVLFALIFKFLPDVRIAWRDVWLGAAVTAALFTVGKYLIGLYLGRAGVATPFGAAGSVVAFVVWVYYSGLILFFGAELTQVSAKHAGRQIVPTENAEPAGAAYAKQRSKSAKKKRSRR